MRQWHNWDHGGKKKNQNQKGKQSCININILAPHSKSLHSIRFDFNSHNIEIACLEKSLLGYNDGYRNIFVTFCLLRK